MSKIHPDDLAKADWDKRKELWRPHCENLQIIWLICPRCATIRVTNQCPNIGNHSDPCFVRVLSAATSLPHLKPRRGQ